MKKRGQIQANKVFQEIMTNCRAERRDKTTLTIRALADDLGITENYLSAVENGREIPSLQIFLEYLIAIGFDLAPLLKLSIDQNSNASTTLSEAQRGLIRRIYDLNELEVEFIAEQSKIAKAVFGRTRRGKKR